MKNTLKGRRQPGRPKADGIDRRQMILDVALVEFGTHGYEGASLAKIAAGADITKAALLHYFDTKESLLAEVLARRDLQSQKNVLRFKDEEKLSIQYLSQEGALMEWSFDGDIWEYLSLLVKLAKINEKNAAQVRLYVSVSAHSTHHDGPGHLWFSQHIKHTVSLIAQGFEQSKAAGQVRDDLDSYAVARTIVAIMDGIQMQWMLSHNHKSEPWMAKDLSSELESYIELLRAQYSADV